MAKKAKKTVLTSTPMRSVNPFFPITYLIGDWVLLVGENRILEITMTYKSSLFAEYRIQDSPDKIFDYKAVDVESKQELTLYPNKYEFIQVPYNCNPTTAKALYGKKPTNK
jgi:hypothetical protein